MHGGTAQLMSRRLDQELVSNLAYEPLPSLPESDIEAPALAAIEKHEWQAISNLDVFFTRIYMYWHDRGIATILTKEILNLLALAFTIVFSGFLLLFVNWGALHSECILKETCDITDVALYRRPWQHCSLAWGVLVGVYLLLLLLYWMWTALRFLIGLPGLLEAKHFFNNKLGVSERQIKVMTWAEVAHRVVVLQQTTRLCLVRDLDEFDIVARIMRKDNYLIAMLNKGVLALHMPIPCLKRRPMLTKTLEWNLYHCILDAMWDERFHIRPEFLSGSRHLQRHLRTMAVANLLLAPFLLVFIIIYFFMHNAERFYNHPGSLGSRRWSPLARWRLREFNELPHLIQHRLDASHKAACSYVEQFPSPLITHAAKFVAFVTGSFVALLLFLTLVDEVLLERPLLGRHIVWWLATMGVVLAMARSLAGEEHTAFDPESAMAAVATQTHWLPRHWRGRAHSLEVQEAFQALFEYQAVLFMEEVAAVLLTPFVLYFSLPKCAGAVVDFLNKYTTRVEGVGDICSLSAFDFDKHGNAKYGAPVQGSKDLRSRQGKMEKSFLSFVVTYPTWEPHNTGKKMLEALSHHTASMHSTQMMPGASGAAGASSSGQRERPLHHRFLNTSHLLSSHPPSFLSSALPVACPSPLNSFTRNLHAYSIDRDRDQSLNQQPTESHPLQHRPEDEDDEHISTTTVPNTRPQIQTGPLRHGEFTPTPAGSCSPAPLSIPPSISPTSPFTSPNPHAASTNSSPNGLTDGMTNSPNGLTNGLTNLPHGLTNGMCISRHGLTALPNGVPAPAPGASSRYIATHALPVHSLLLSMGPQGEGSRLLSHSLLASGDTWASAEMLPGNETIELSSRLQVHHSTLQSFYEQHDEMVQHRLATSRMHWTASTLGQLPNMQPSFL